MYDEAASEQILSPGSVGRPPDYVIDAIDDVKTKAALLRECSSRGLPVIAVLGAGAKVNPQASARAVALAAASTVVVLKEQLA